LDLHGKRDVPESEFHEIDDICATSNEEDFHQGVVHGDIAEGEINVARYEDQGLQSLCLKRYSWQPLK